MKKIVFLLTFLSALSGFAQNDALFEQGKELYKSEKYNEALASWMKILNSKEHSAALYFNLGNAHYKLNQIGPSIYYYEKALQLAPNDSDIQNNLAFAENARIDTIEPLPQTIFTRWYKGISGVLTYDGWAIATTVCSILFVILFLLYYFSASEQKKRLLFTSSIVSICVLLFSLVMAFKTYDDFIKNRSAIIFSERTEVKSEPTLGSEVAFVLHEGTKVQILEQDDQWYRIELADGKDGWLPATELKEL
ncbi:tetratricopeptide repeat protein [Ulvibacter sp. MAR_2010_11]|uniref:SH3 domain-containing protein n=1 Tax=Ulvibacter sp. MAR_2010_11 TaxID=1250229 RepID=UPI000C2C2B14|nr:tetratricopeptide repeat protein [Ulvibacter sp. MAR_2010_11]PKA83045.1 tetratricopeptide repeat protein [Ulvibacter sp. MAR_2010_11]